MSDRIFHPDRRALMAGLGAATLSPLLPHMAAAEVRQMVALQAKASAMALRPGQLDTPIWSIGAQNDALRFKRGDTLDVNLTNDTTAPIALNWRGLDGVPTVEPLLAEPALAAQAKQSLVVPLRHAGTFMCDLRLLGDGQGRPSAARALIVGESDAVAVDRDEALLFEDWRLRPDGIAVTPGSDPNDTVAIYTVNGQRTLDIPVRLRDRLRLRFINAFQRNVIAIKIENHDVQVIALDGQPSEPFLARNGAVVLAPGGRADVFIDTVIAPGAAASILLHDGTEARPIARLVGSREAPVRSALLAAALPLLSNGLPDRLDLRTALRVDLPLNGPHAGWIAPATFSTSAAPAFKAKAGRVVVLALTNRADKAIVFHLHGHHFRLLDRLDDGWKPFWLDTLAVEPGQTQRIACAADAAGRWLMEATATDWAAPRRLRWYSVE
ncbi:MAG: multicopper oxidase domain-containing protein [Bradyrhizobium sp.]